MKIVLKGFKDINNINLFKNLINEETLIALSSQNCLLKLYVDKIDEIKSVSYDTFGYIQTNVKVDFNIIVIHNQSHKLFAK